MIKNSIVAAFILFTSLGAVGKEKAPSNHLGGVVSPTNELEKAIDKNKGWIRITDVTYYGLPFLAVRAFENYNKWTTEFSLKRAAKICVLAGYNRPTAVDLDWHTETRSALSITESYEISEVQPAPYMNYEGQTFYFATFNSISCTK